jgi:hypothetical protein
VRPTREGRHSPFRPGLVFRGIGVDPEVPTEDPPDPTDRAADGLAYVPFLPPPEAGAAEDLNLSFGTCSDGGGDRPVTNPTKANDGDILTYAGRNSFFNGGGTKTWWLESDLGSALEVDDIVIRGGFGNAGENDPPWLIEHSDDGSAWTTAAGSYVRDDTTNPRTATLTLTSAQTKRYWRIGQTITSAGLIYPLQVNTWQINGPATASDPTNVLWVDAPLTIDGDDATYEYADEDAITATSGPFWRGTLDDTFLIASLLAEVGFESAGSVTVLIQAGNESDYSDAATITSTTLTATGSYTADTVTASWVPTDVYQYWQLVLSTAAQGVHVFEVSLLDPPTFTGAHEDLTGRDVADQHPADAVTYDNTVSGLTADDVQAAIDELAAGSSSGPDVSLVEVAAAGATETVDVSVARTYDLTLTDDLTLTLSGAVDNEAHYVVVAFRQDGTGGWTVTHPGSVVWLGGSEPTIDADPAAVTWVTYLSLDGGTVWYGFPTGGGVGTTDHDSLTGVSANDHHNQAHALTGSDHTLSGLTEGHVYTATSATTAAFQALTVSSHWEVVMTGTGAGLEPVTNDEEDDWLYAEV